VAISTWYWSDNFVIQWVERWLSFRAGKLDAGEQVFDCARRELQEETGFSAKQWAHAGRINPVIAYSTEFIDIWFARHLVSGVQHLDAGEFVEGV
jgi:ADP-ribose pyrophosphatase